VKSEKTTMEVDGMKESVAIAKEANRKQGSSPTRSDNSIQHLRKEPERQIGSLRSVVGNIRRNDGVLSVESIATELSVMPSTDRASALLALQQTHGNRYVQRVVTGIQAKLKIGQPGDKYEQEADRVAEQVMQMPEPQVQRQVEPEEEEEEEFLQTKPLAEQITTLVQRQVEEEVHTKSVIQKQPKEYYDEEEVIRTKETGETRERISEGIERQINSLKGSGQPMGNTERTFFESRFGADFSPVRLHTGSKASGAARALNAKAFTVGHDVVFGAGQYQPHTTAGKKLTAHELAHVIQQNADISHLNHESTADSIRTTKCIQRNSGKGSSPTNSALQWDYTFRSDGHIIATARQGATLWGLARYWSWKGINYPAITHENGSRVTNPHLIHPGDKFDVFPIMPAFYRSMVGNTGTGNCGNAAFAYLGMCAGPANNSRTQDFSLFQQLSAGATNYAGNVVVWSTTGSAPGSSSELNHFAIYLADGQVFTKNGAGSGLYQVMSISSVEAIYGSSVGRWHKS